MGGCWEAGPSLPPCPGLGLLPTWEGGREIWGAVTGDIGKGSPWRGGGGRGGGGRPTVRCLYERAVRTTCQERQTEREKQRTREGQSPPPPPQGLTHPQGWPWMSKLPLATVHIQPSWATTSSCHRTPTSTSHTQQGACPMEPASAQHTPRNSLPHTWNPSTGQAHAGGKHSDQQTGSKRVLQGEAEAARRILIGNLGESPRARALAHPTCTTALRQGLVQPQQGCSSQPGGTLAQTRADQMASSTAHCLAKARH